MTRMPRWARLLGPILVGVAGAALALQAFAKTTVDAGPFQVQLEADFGRSVTDISLPPLGRLRADTHGAPLHLRASLREVDVEALQEGLRRGVDSVAAEVERNTFDAVGWFAAWVVLVGVAGAAALGLLAFRNRWLEVLRATEAGLLAVVLSVGFTAIGFNAAAFQAPSYTGSLRLVPQLFGPVEGAIERVGYFRDELRRVVAGAARAYAAVESNPLGRGDEIRVLHISDIHLSTLGYGFAQELARSFDVDLVIDTGDTTSFGAPNEEFILSEIPDFELPYVWVRGNHDSADFQDALAEVDETVVLDGETAEVDGFTIYGLGHPYFNEQRGTPTGDEDVIELVEAAAERVVADVGELAEPPDILLVHDDRMAEGVAGMVPLVVSGHFHEDRDEVVDGTLFLRVGTTGGAGPTGFTAEGNVPFSAEVLYFRDDTDGDMQLVAWDVVTQFPETGSLEIERHLASDVGVSPSPSLPGTSTASSSPSPSE
ncbi:MAG TPA: metallophosphoesterase [Actinomycetota bacterium]|nr:metallophosphoesterase [Actinomycetota bacterium]